MSRTLLKELFTARHLIPALGHPALKTVLNRLNTQLAVDPAQRKHWRRTTLVWPGVVNQRSFEAVQKAAASAREAGSQRLQDEARDAGHVLSAVRLADSLMSSRRPMTGVGWKDLLDRFEFTPGQRKRVIEYLDACHKGKKPRVIWDEAHKRYRVYEAQFVR